MIPSDSLYYMAIYIYASGEQVPGVFRTKFNIHTDLARARFNIEADIRLGPTNQPTLRMHRRFGPPLFSELTAYRTVLTVVNVRIDS